MIFLSVGPDTFQNAHKCIIAGNAKPKPDRQNAPNSDMKRSNSGTVIASMTETGCKCLEIRCYGIILYFTEYLIYALSMYRLPNFNLTVTEIVEIKRIYMIAR